MAVRVRRNFSLKHIGFTDRAMMADVGSLVRRLVRSRTQAGKDANGAPFRPLSPGYAEQKRKATGSSAANLTLSGRMLNEFDVTDVSGHTVSVGFRGGISGGGGSGTLIQRSRAVNGATKAFYHTGAGRVTRDFLGLTSKEQRTVERALEKAIDQKMRTMGRR